MTIHKIPVGVLSTNCLFVVDDETRSAMVVDPGGDVDMLEQRLRTLGVKPVMIVFTHGHFDHTLAASDLSRSFDVPIAMAENDLPLYQEMRRQVVKLFGEAAADEALSLPLVMPTRMLAHGDELACGSLHAKVIALPGHSPGGIGLLFARDPGVMAVGDTIFRDGVGRTDLWGGDEPALTRSIREQILTLPDTTRLIPGHGPETTVGQERRHF